MDALLGNDTCVNAVRGRFVRFTIRQAKKSYAPSTPTRY
jgi:hypothetical protein